MVNEISFIIIRTARNTGCYFHCCFKVRYSERLWGLVDLRDVH